MGYLAPQIRSINRRFYSEAELPLVIFTYYPLAKLIPSQKALTLGSFET